MKNRSNIEPSAFRRGEYVGYADGAWKIRRNSAAGGWIAVKQAGGRFLHGDTLAQIGAKLDEYAASRKVQP